MSKAVEKALLTLGLLVVFGILIAYLSVHYPVWKEFTGTIAGGIVGLVVLIFSVLGRDDAKKAREAGERAEGEARQGREKAEAAEQSAKQAVTTAAMTARQRAKVRRATKA